MQEFPRAELPEPGLGSNSVHRFNDLVSIVIGYSEVLLNRLGPDDALRPLVREIHQAGEQLLAFQSCLVNSRDTLPDIRPRPAPPAPTPATILLVEDEPPIRQLASSILRQAGYQVLEAGHGLEALLACKDHGGPIHLLLTDVVLPQISGAKLAQRLRALYPDLKIIFTSGYGAGTAAQFGIEPNAVFLAKPFSRETLVRTVREVLGKGS